MTEFHEAIKRNTWKAWDTLVAVAKEDAPILNTQTNKMAVIAAQERIAELEAIQLDHSLATQYLTQLLKSHTRVIPAETLAGLCSQIDNLLTGVHIKLPDWTGVIENPFSGSFISPDIFERGPSDGPTSTNPGATTQPGGMDDGVYRVDGGPAETGKPGTANFKKVVECPFCAQVIYTTIGTIPAHKTSMRADCAAIGMTIADAKYQAQFLPTMDGDK